MKNKTTLLFFALAGGLLTGYLLSTSKISEGYHRDVDKVAYGNVMLNSYLNAARDFNCYLPKVSDLGYGVNKDKIDLSSTIDNSSICKPEQKETILRAWHGPYALIDQYYSTLISVVQDKDTLYFQIESRTPTAHFKEVANQYCTDSKEYLVDCSATEEKLRIKLLPFKDLK